MTSIDDPAIAVAYASLPETHRRHALKLRSLIFDVAGHLDRTGGIVETIKWGQPSYLPVKPRIGSTIRVGIFDDDHAGLFVHCQSTLIERFRTLVGDELTYAGNRAVLLPLSHPVPDSLMTMCIRLALYYHLDNRAKVNSAD